MGKIDKYELFKLIEKDPKILTFIKEESLNSFYHWDSDNLIDQWNPSKIIKQLGLCTTEIDNWISKENVLDTQIDYINAHAALKDFIKNPETPYNQSVTYLHKSGYHLIVNIRIYCINNNQNQEKPYIGTRQVQKVLKNNHELLYKLTQHVPGVIYQYRYHADGRNYFPYASDNIWDIYEVTPEEVINDASKVLSRLHPEDFDAVVASIVKSSETLEIWDEKYRVILPEKGTRWLHGQSQPEKLEDGSVLWHGYIQDITEEYEIQKNLETSQQRWKFALEGAKDGVWDWNIKTNEVYFSPQWKAMLGYQDDEIENKFDEWSKRVHPDDLQKCYDEIDKYFNNEIKIYSIIHRILSKEGKYFWILARGKIIEYDENGAPLRFVGTHTDLTERIEMEKSLTEKNNELEQFTYITSHDLQEPLNSIISFASLLERENDNISDIGKKSIEIITNSTYRMKDFITSLLEYTRIGKEKQKVKVSIIGLINNLKQDLHDLIQKYFATIEYIGPDIKVDAFEPDLIKLFQNIIVNGIKYSREETLPVVIINCNKDNEFYTFSIKDNGIGIEEKYYNKIFEVFQRLHTRDKYTGTGIGLAYCKKVVDLHKGKIWLESEIGKGSTFYFTISK